MVMFIAGVLVGWLLRSLCLIYEDMQCPEAKEINLLNASHFRTEQDVKDWLE